MECDVAKIEQLSKQPDIVEGRIIHSLNRKVQKTLVLTLKLSEKKFKHRHKVS
jgi:hypothetical protein